MTNAYTIMENKTLGIYNESSPNQINYFTLYGACMSPETTHKLMGFYMEVLILGIIL